MKISGTSSPESRLCRKSGSIWTTHPRPISASGRHPCRRLKGFLGWARTRRSGGPCPRPRNGGFSGAWKSHWTGEQPWAREKWKKDRLSVIQSFWRDSGQKGPHPTIQMSGHFCLKKTSISHLMVNGRDKEGQEQAEEDQGVVSRGRYGGGGCLSGVVARAFVALTGRG